MPEAKVLDPATTFRFEVQARGANIGFSKVTGLKDESEKIEYREGSDQNLFRRQLPGLRTAPNLVCERGLGPGRELLAWRNAVIKCQDFRSTVTVTVKNCDGTTSRKLTFEKAWPVGLQISDLDGKTSEVAIETMELVHEGRISQSIIGF